MDFVEMALEYNRGLKDSLQLLWDELNYGQKKKLLKNPRIQEMVNRFGIETTEKQGGTKDV